MVAALGLATLLGCAATTAPAARAPGAAPVTSNATPDASPQPVTRDAVLARPLGGEQPRLPADPHQLAAYLALAEDVVRDAAEPPARVAAAGWTAQHAYRALSRRTSWQPIVLAALPYRYRSVARHHLSAARALGKLTARDLPGSMPSWRIVRPESVTALRGHYAAGQRRYGVPWEVLAAVNLVETRMGRIVGLSSAGARGPMQFMPATWRAYGDGDIDDPRDSILAAARYLAANGGADGTQTGLRRALRRYNNSSHYVTGVLHYAAVLRAEPRAYHGAHAWQVYYRTRAGEALLPVGYESRGNPSAHRWLERNPEARVRYF